MKEAKTIFVAACDPKGGVYTYELSPEGRLREKGALPLDCPVYMAKENGSLYYVLNDPRGDGFSAVGHAEITENGALRPAGEPVPTPGIVSCYITAVNGQIYTAEYRDGTVSRIGVKTVKHEGIGVNLPRQDKPHVHYVELTPDRKYLAVVDLGLDSIVTYDFGLNRLGTARVPLGKGCRHLAFSADGRYAYCVNELSSDLSVFAYADGVFTYLNTVKLLPDDFTAKNTAAAVRCTGDYVYVSHRGYDRISKLRCEGAEVEKVCDLPCGGRGPRDFIVLEDLIIATNEVTNNLAVLRETEDGAVLTDERSLPDPLAVLAL